MLDDTLKTQLQSHLLLLRHPIELTASLADDATSHELRDLLETIASLSDRVSLRLDGQDQRRPSFRISPVGQSHGVSFAGLPLGHEFTSLVLALLWTGGHPPKVEESVLNAIRQLQGPKQFEVYMSLSCHNCPDVVQALTLMSIVNPQIQTVVIEGGAFQDEVNARGIMAVPSTFLNGENFGSGRMSLEEIVMRLDSGAAEREAQQLAARDTFDVLVVGGGPAGAAAAIYAARKGIRTGIVAERIGGQVNDTMGIENFISSVQTDGPTLSAAMERHIKAYDIDVMTQQKIDALQPAAQPGGPVGVKLSNGAVLTAKSVVLATGARWRSVNVPGEQEYKNKGVAYCPHCDGPLFKGKRTAVIGGGNSGVEAAIDLAGIVEHVTLLEFAPQLKADAILVAKLKSLPNVTVITHAQTAAITGDGNKVSGLSYIDRTSGQTHDIAIAGVFVQIGLIPNSDFAKGVLELSAHGEIIINERCETSLPGVFAAGDVTTVPYKQIIIAAGEGAKAALSAFDHLIRTPVVQDGAVNTKADKPVSQQPLKDTASMAAS
jgi:alkyl hydroperoxide reductase subunit F